MEELVKAMREVLANTFVFYFKNHAFHWNVEGIHFSQYHGFFGDLYDELHSAVDPIAEEIRALGAYAPTSMNELYKDCTLSESNLVGDSVKQMLASDLMDNEQMVTSLNKAFAAASAVNNQGLMNFLADRLDKHKKHAWMLRASLKGAY